MKTNRLYEVLTWDTETQSWTPQQGIPDGPFTRTDLIHKIMPTLRDLGYECDPKEIDEIDSGNQASAGSPSLLIEHHCEEFTVWWSWWRKHDEKKDDLTPDVRESAYLAFFAGRETMRPKRKAKRSKKTAM